MPIEGPLRDLGVHEVFQLLDLGRKTGVLRISSVVRDNAGEVYFSGGAVVAASIRTNPHSIGMLMQREGRVSREAVERARAAQEAGDRRKIGELLVAHGDLAPQELSAFVRHQIEVVVFELLSWREGVFAFHELLESEIAALAGIRVSAEALLMEASRRADVWANIAELVAGPEAVPVLAPAPQEDWGARIHLEARDWDVLAEIDGVRSIREIAASLSSDEFDVARSVHGMIATALLEIRS